MVVERGLFVPQTGSSPNFAGTNPTQARLAVAGLVAENSPGVPRQGLLRPSNPIVVTGANDMSYNVAPINPVTTRAAAGGVYVYTTTGTTNRKTTPAPGANSRYDIIWTKQNDTQYGDTDNFADVYVTQGSPAASPTKPAPTLNGNAVQGALVLAEVLVQSGATATNSASVQITQVWKYTSSRGAPIPVRNLAERAELTPVIGTTVQRLDQPGAPIETFDGTYWVLQGAGFYLELARDAGNNQANQVWGPGVASELSAAVNLSASRNPGIFSFPSANRVTVGKAGIYAPSWAITNFSSGASGYILIKRDSTGQVIAAKQMNATGDISVERSAIYLDAGESLDFNFQTSTQVTCKHLLSIARIG